jgi:hypothetical protein
MAKTQEWVQDVSAQDGSQRLERLKLIDEWFKYDELLRSYTKVLVQRERFSATVWSSFSSQILQNAFLVTIGAIIALLAQR